MEEDRNVLYLEQMNGDTEAASSRGKYTRCAVGM